MPEIKEDVIENDDLFKVIGKLLDSSPYAPKCFPIGQLQDAKIQIVQSHHYDRPQENTNPYTPKIISIGPLHHGKPELQPMENFKHKLLKDLLNSTHGRGVIPSPSSDGTNDELLRRFITAAREMEERVRRCYVLPPNTITSDDFVKMLVIDGCFLLEFLIRSLPFITWVDLGWRLPLIKIDILLLENQIPFFVLEEFYKIHIGFSNCTDTMMEIACRYLYFGDTWENNPFIKTYKYDFTQISDSALNLLHLYHSMILNKQHQQTSINLIRKWTMSFFSRFFVSISYSMFLIHLLLFAKPLYRTRATTAMELEEAGVRFKGSGMDLRFDKGTFFIPVLSLDDKKICIFKNLLAFEFYYRDMVDPVVQRYVAMLFHLIKNPEEVLEKHHIIITGSSGEESFRLISDLLESGFDYETFINLNNRFSEEDPNQIKDALVVYCQERRHRWRAKLMKDYFGNPWSILGVFVGALLLVLTTLQTVFTVLSYYN